LDAPGTPSPDGSLLLWAKGRGSLDGEEWWVHGPRREKARRLIVFTPTAPPTHRTWSPDSSRLAYVRLRPAPGGAFTQQESVIETVEISSGAVTEVLEPFKPHRPITGLAWPSADRIVFALGAPRPDITEGNLWELPLTPGGEARPLTQWSGRSVSHLSSSADGKRVAFVLSAYGTRAMIAEWGAGGRISGTTRAVGPPGGSNSPGGWTSDSQAVLLVSRRNGSEHLLLQRLDGSPAQTLAGGRGRRAFPCITPDGSAVLYLTAAEGRGEEAPLSRLMRVSASGGAAALVYESEALTAAGCAPQGPCIVEERTVEGRAVSLLDPQTGKGARLIEARYLGTAALAPEGKRLAYVVEGRPANRIAIVSLTGRVQRELLVADGRALHAPAWSADGKGIFCGDRAPGSGARLWYVPMDGPPRVIWRNEGPAEVFAVPSPDGGKIAIQAGGWDSGVWMLEGF
jgi:Tol biopolymer transport system component